MASLDVCELCGSIGDENGIVNHPHIPVKLCIPCLLSDLNANIAARGATTVEEAIDYKPAWQL